MMEEEEVKVMGKENGKEKKEEEEEEEQVKVKEEEEEEKEVEEEEDEEEEKEEEEYKEKEEIKVDEQEEGWRLEKEEEQYKENQHEQGQKKRLVEEGGISIDQYTQLWFLLVIEKQEWFAVPEDDLVEVHVCQRSKFAVTKTNKLKPQPPFRMI